MWTALYWKTARLKSCDWLYNSEPPPHMFVRVHVTSVPFLLFLTNKRLVLLFKPCCCRSVIWFINPLPFKVRICKIIIRTPVPTPKQHNFIERRQPVIKTHVGFSFTGTESELNYFPITKLQNWIFFLKRSGSYYLIPSYPRIIFSKGWNQEPPPFTLTHSPHPPPPAEIP